MTIICRYIFAVLGIFLSFAGINFEKNNVTVDTHDVMRQEQKTRNKLLTPSSSCCTLRGCDLICAACEQCCNDFMTVCKSFTFCVFVQNCSLAKISHLKVFALTMDTCLIICCYGQIIIYVQYKASTVNVHAHML